MRKVFLMKFAAMAMLLVLAAVGVQAQTVSAHTKCKVPLPFNGWTEGCPHLHSDIDDGSSGSCLSFMTDERYDFRINNETGNQVIYHVNDERFTLSDGYGRNHSYRKAYGTSSCSITQYPKPEITFDYSYTSGYQKRAYNIGGLASYTFAKSGGGLDLFDSRSVPSQSTGSTSGSGGSAAASGSGAAAAGSNSCISSISLVDARADQALWLLSDGGSMNSSALPSKLNIRANVGGCSVESIKFSLSGGRYWNSTENHAPFELFGNNSGELRDHYLLPGTYRLTVTPYSDHDLGGQMLGGRPHVINFTVR